MGVEKLEGLTRQSREVRQGGEEEWVKFSTLSSGLVLPLCVLCDLGQVTLPLWVLISSLVKWRGYSVFLDAPPPRWVAPPQGRGLCVFHPWLCPQVHDRAYHIVAAQTVFVKLNWGQVPYWNKIQIEINSETMVAFTLPCPPLLSLLFPSTSFLAAFTWNFCLSLSPSYSLCLSSFSFALSFFLSFLHFLFSTLFQWWFWATDKNVEFWSCGNQMDKNKRQLKGLWAGRHCTGSARPGWMALLFLAGQGWGPDWCLLKASGWL